MGEPLAVRRQPARGIEGLVEDLVRLQIAAELSLAGRAERAADRAADLGGDAERGAPRVAHRHRLDRVSTVEPVEQLRGQAPIGGRLGDRLQRAEPEGSGEVGAEPGREVVHRLEGGRAAGEPTAHLLGAKGRLAVRLQPLHQLLGAQ